MRGNGGSHDLRQDPDFPCSRVELVNLSEGPLLINNFNAFSYNNACRDFLFKDDLIMVKAVNDVNLDLLWGTCLCSLRVSANGHRWFG